MCASMRPRVFPAEDVRREAATRVDGVGFNEAAGIPRGRQFYADCPVCHGQKLQ